MFRVGRMEAPQAVSPKTSELSEEHVDPIFYDDPKTAALKVLGGP